ncbi:SpoIIE family protein phosphatase [Flammeovirga sp. EKP202]|nr:SpoIIE family protein phosphatase [Flammeovirga sp. EKP202]
MLLPFTVSKEDDHLLALYRQERIRKCYSAIPFFFISYLMIISYYVLDDFRVFEPSSLFTFSRIPSIIFSLVLIVLRFTNSKDGKLKNYWIPMYTVTITSIIYSLYAVAFLAYEQPDYFLSGLYVITGFQFTALIYSIMPTSVAIGIIGVGASTFTTAIYYQYGAFSSSYDIPNFIAVSIISIVVLFVKYNNTFRHFKSHILLKEEKTKSDSLFQLTLEQNEKLQSQKEFINQQKDILSNHYNDMQESLQYAQRIQNAMLPLPFYNVEKVKEYFNYSAPKHIVSGDFYWFGKSENAQIIVVGDCTGHGVPGALMSMLGISILNRLVTQENVDDPLYIIEKMHLRLNTLLQQNSTHNNDGMALSVIRVPLYHDQNSITFCGAKSPVLFVKKEGIEFYRGGRYYIGGNISPINKCQNITIDIEPGMMMYLYSDGFRDQFGGILDKKYTGNQFRSFLQKIATEPTAIQKQLLDSEFLKWKNAKDEDNTQVDDVLVAGFRF